jgi:hypothetical protein
MWKALLFGVVLSGAGIFGGPRSFAAPVPQAGTERVWRNCSMPSSTVRSTISRRYCFATTYPCFRGRIENRSRDGVRSGAYKSVKW